MIREALRLFVALEPPPAVTRALGELGDRLRGLEGAGAVRWVDPAGVHLTLKFLGYVEAGRVPALREALAGAASASPALALRAGGFGIFPNPRRPRVLWLGLEGDLDALARLQAAVERACAALGFAAEERAFAPHLTLGRVRAEAVVADRARLTAAFLATPPVEAAWTAQQVSLMQSRLTPAGARYTRLAAVPLGGGAG